MMLLLSKKSELRYPLSNIVLIDQYGIYKEQYARAKRKFFYK